MGIRSRSSWFFAVSALLVAALATGARAGGVREVRTEELQHVAALVAMPGDIVLVHLSGSPVSKAAWQLGIYPAGLADLLALNDPITKYGHAEVITGIEDASRLRTSGFYPFEKTYRQNQFDDCFAIYRVKGPITVQENALEKVCNRKYGGWGFCSDFVAWAFDDRIYSWWNVVPWLRDVIVLLYPPEAIHTADDLANSPQTRKILEVLNGRVVYPAHLPTQKVVEELARFQASGNAAIVSHVANVRRRLIECGVINEEGTVLQSELDLSSLAVPPAP
jgi:hypothetical protein